MDCQQVDQAPIRATEKLSAPRMALASIVLAMLVASLGVSIASAMLPTLSHTYEAPLAEVQWVVIAYLLAVTVAVAGVGQISDVWGHRQALLGGIVVFTVASILCAVAPSLRLLIVARAVQGLGAAVLMATSMVLVRQTISQKSIGSAMGLLGTVSALGTALGPSLSGLLLALSGWRASFVTMALLGLMCFTLAYRFVPVSQQAPLRRDSTFNVKGSLVLAFTLAAYALGMTVGNGQLDTLTVLCLLCACLGGGVLVRVESRAQSPVLPMVLLKNRTIAIGLAANLASATVLMSTLVVGPFYLTGALGFGVAHVGLVVSMGPLLGAVSGVPAGLCVDRLGVAASSVIGLCVMITGSLGLTVLPAMVGFAGYLISILILTPGFQLFQAANNTRIMAEAPLDKQGLTSGLVSLARNLGLITGASVMGSVFTVATGASDFRQASAQAIGNGVQAVFGLATVLLLVALVFSVSNERKLANARRALSRQGEQDSL